MPLNGEVCSTFCCLAVAEPGTTNDIRLFISHLLSSRALRFSLHGATGAESLVLSHPLGSGAGPQEQVQGCMAWGLAALGLCWLAP